MQQRLGHGCGSGQRKAHGFRWNSTACSRWMRAVSSLAWANESVQCHAAQELHVGRQAHDVGLRQGFIQPRQRLARACRHAR